MGTRSLFWFEGGTSVPAKPAVSAPARGQGDPTRLDAGRPSGPLRLVHAVAQPAARLPRILSTAQRQALNQMIGLGARLDDTFTLQELRSEFRALARLYHPDRQQPGPRSSWSTSGGRFVTLRHAYDLLKTAA